MKHCKLFAALIALLVVACEDELVPKPEASEKIGYSVSVNSNGWQAGTRSADSLRMPRITIEPLEQKLGGKPVYLHTVVENTIPDNIKTATDSPAAGTRGSIVKTGGVTDLSVSAYVSNSDPWSDEDAKLYMQNVKSTSPNWSTNYFWPTTQSFIRFFAYSPTAALENGLTTTAYPPTFSYTVEDNIQAQADLLVASAQYDGNYCQPAHLEFGHALTAVTIKLKDMDQFTIKSLKLSGVKKSGTYTYSYNVNGDSQEGTATHDAGAWDESGEANASYTYYFDTGTNGELQVTTTAPEGELSGYTYTTGAGEVTLNEGILTLLLMPQTLTADAQITVTGTDILIDKEVNLTAAIGVDSEGKAKTWEKGKHVTYTLSLKDQTVTYVFNVEPDTTTPVTASSVPWYGATGLQYKVTDSYKIITRGNNHSDPIPVEWKVTYPSWVDETTIPGGTLQDGIVSENEAKVGMYGVVTTDYEARLNTAGWNAENHDPSASDELRKRTEEGTEASPYDLSTKGGIVSMHTANCYMVTAPGYYKLPLVYGNAIQNGSDAPQAYSTSEVGETARATLRNADKTVMAGKTERSIAVNVLANFKDHADADITQPWIVTSQGGNYEAASAEIVWQDEPCLLTEVKLCGADYLQFRVREDCITEGNAVVAVKNSEGVIMWSWHIWVTDCRNIFDTNYSGIASFNTSTAITNRQVLSTTETDNWELEENTFNILKAHIGHCDGEVKTYKGRTGTILFEQVENSAVKNSVSPISIVQGGGSAENTEVITTGDNAVYYQWGRKDPMPGGVKSADGTTIKDKTCYGSGRTPVTAIIKAGKQASFGEAIQHPNTYYSRDADDSHSDDVHWYKWWSDRWIIYYNLWNSQSNVLPMLNYYYSYEPSTAEGRERGISTEEFFNEFKSLLDKGVTKTVYDPCPPGYEMPRLDMFTGITYDGIRRANYFNKEDNTLLDYVNVMPESISTTAYTYNENGEKNSFWPATLNALSFYVLPMKQKVYYKRASGTDEPENQTYLVQALGCRNSSGDVIQYGVFGCAATSGVMCVQWEH